MEGSQIHEVPHTRIVDSPFQTRSNYDEPKLAELAANIVVHGVLQPVLARMVGDIIELIAGHRRVRASRIAGKETIPVIFREMSDEQAREVVIVENLQREDVHALDEAAIFAGLMADYGRTAQQLADKIGKTRAYVLRRLTLNGLCPLAQLAFREGRLSEYGAFSVARILDAALQEAATNELCAGKDVAGRNAVRQVVESYLLTLDDAPFDTKSATLLPSAGACTACPKRSGACADLFGDLSRADLCSDSACYRAKAEATWTVSCEEALAKGHEVLDEEASRKLFPYGGRYLAHESEYVDLSMVCPMDDRRRTWKAVLGRSLPPVTLAQDGQGFAHLLVREVDALSVVAPPQVAGKPKSDGIAHVATASMTAPDVASAERPEDRRAVFKAGLPVIVAAAEAAPIGVEFLRFVARGLLEASWADVRKAVARRRGLGTKAQPDAGLLEAVEKMSSSEVQGLLAEVVASRFGVPSHAGSTYGTGFLAACALYGVTLQQLESSIGETRNAVEPPTLAAPLTQGEANDMPEAPLADDEEPVAA
ncbi:ParB/RepB/Spo0J family partition protein [Corallococcus terminator]|nr:ParB/RepB/Spo0J family partition protein [Corallococcus terminator]